MIHQNAVSVSSSKTTANTTSGQEVGTTQTSVTSASATSTGVANTSKVGFNALVQNDSVLPQTHSTPAATAQIDAANSYDDTYWAKQPAAVQQLRNISDPAQRQQMAATLASQGYQIDVPIMAWGWDAGITTALRSSAGYTWVPSALGANVTAAPGITGPGITPYDPNHPPPGSIAVTA